MPQKICIPLKASSLSELLAKIEEATPHADILELWLGELPSEEIDFEKIFASKKKPFLLNVKGKKEKGKFAGTDEEKLEILLEGAKHGAEYCDVDYEFAPKLLEQFVQAKGKTELILSAHFFEGTPSLPSLLNRIQRMKHSGADIVKIAAMANENKDLITILRLAENLKRQEQKFIAISMGEKGKFSRVLTPLLGGEMMFAALSEKDVTAPGQLTVEKLRNMWK